MTTGNDKIRNNGDGRPGGAYPFVQCPRCGWKLFERESHTAGIVTAKCARCGRRVTVDIAWRTASPGLSRRLAGLM